MTKRRKITIAVLGVLGLPLLAIVLFILNGTMLCAGTTPRGGTVASTRAPEATHSRGTRVMAFNIAKCFVYEGGRHFADRDSVELRLDAIADIILTANPDVVCLSEIVHECGPCDVDQVRYLAEHTGLPNWSFGECFSFGFPFYRVVSGNAIISRHPVRPLANLDLAGRKPFYIAKNNRRALVAEVALPDGNTIFWSLHNDSFNLSNNLDQVQQILAYPLSEDAFLAGDFNARPTDESMLTFRQSGRFAGVFDGPNTFPADHPTRAIDFVLAPIDFTVNDHTVITNRASDHCAVVTTFTKTREASYNRMDGTGWTAPVMLTLGE